MDSDDFGLSSGDEDELLVLGGEVNTAAAKRKNEDPPFASKRVRTNDATSDLSRKLLRDRFRKDDFKLKQEMVVKRLLGGGSAVVVFPTGGGKSLCYQLPALCFKELDRISGQRQGPAEGGITLVISPLIALMKDQVDAVKRLNISAEVMDSTKNREDYSRTMDKMRDGTLDILYCAPERLNNEGFAAKMAQVRGGIRLLAIDEAHCISEWGHAFRPDYLKVARFAAETKAERVVALTATATPKVAEDVRSAFSIDEDGVFRTPTYRPNLSLHAQSYQTKQESYPALRAFLTANPGPTIIYVTLQRHTEELAAQLRQQNFTKTRHFHAGMKPEERTACQEAFMKSKDMIVVATIAFGMGIDKADIRNVVHYDIPRSLEGYSQEIGRAGRDGLVSQCLLFLCAEDLHLRESFARGDLPSKPAVTSLLRRVFSTPRTKDDYGNSSLELPLFQQAKEFDIKETVLKTIYAMLELRFNAVRATTPKYTAYSYTGDTSHLDRSKAAEGIRKATQKKAKWVHIDVDQAARLAGGVSRNEIVSKLNDWNDENRIELKTGGVMGVYRIMKGFPSTPKDQRAIIDSVYKELEVREQQDLARMMEMIDLITGSTCFARRLSEHFGDSLPDGNQECGHCSWCQKKQPVQQVTRPTAGFNQQAFARVLEACPNRDDPRLLARLAFGLNSPRISALKLSKDPVFGSMEDCDFQELHRRFAEVCGG